MMVIKYLEYLLVTGCFDTSSLVYFQNYKKSELLKLLFCMIFLSVSYKRDVLSIILEPIFNHTYSIRGSLSNFFKSSFSTCAYNSPLTAISKQKYYIASYATIKIPSSKLLKSLMARIQFYFQREAPSCSPLLIELMIVDLDLLVRLTTESIGLDLLFSNCCSTIPICIFFISIVTQTIIIKSSNCQTILKICIFDLLQLQTSIHQLINNSPFFDQGKVMLKKLQKTGHQQIASKSAIKELRASLIKLSKFPEEQIEILFPKKGKVALYKLKGSEEHKIEHVVVDKELHFISVDEYCVPALKTIHSYPDMYPRFTADEGALKFILKGANLMAPGLINEQASMQEVEQGAIVSVYVHGHEHCMAVGIAKMSSKKIKQTKQGLAVQIIHYIGDSFWTHLYKS